MGNCHLSNITGLKGRGNTNVNTCRVWMEGVGGDALNNASRLEQKWYKAQDKKPRVTRITIFKKEKKKLKMKIN
jgi:hypothetical protein